MRFAPRRPEHRELVARQVALLEDAVADRVVDVVVDVGDAVDDADDLALERLRLAVAGVREDAVDDLVREVQPAARCARTARCGGSRPATRVGRAPPRPRGRTAGGPMSWPSPIASVRSSFSAQRARDDARDAGRLERVGHARAVVVAGRVDEDLRLALQPAERLRVEDAVAVALERRADAALLLGAGAPARLVRAHGERRERALLQLAHARGEGVGNSPGKLGHTAHGSRRSGRQMMIGTVPPSADQAAPVTYEARSEQQEDDHGGDLLRLGEPAERPPRADLREHLLAARPAGRRGRPRRARRRSPSGPGVTALQRIAVAGVEVGDEARVGEHRRLHHRVVRHRPPTAASPRSTRR